jgi:hypothetical protein
MSEFRLEKWYCDVTDDSNRGFIGYGARLQWKSIQINYLGYTFLNAKGEINNKNVFVKTSVPEISDENMIWNSSAFQLSMKRIDFGIGEILLKDGTKEILWHCFFPKSIAQIRIGSESFNGFGYAERINLSYLPWNLPIQQLIWGRFLSDDFTLIWIKWIGPIPKSIVYFNGVKIPEVTINEFQISFMDYILMLLNPLELRAGTLLSNVFSKVPWIAGMFPTSIMQLTERKWLSHGLLRKNGLEISTGNSVHELVIWK